MRTVYGIRDTSGVLIAHHIRIDDNGSKRFYWSLPGGDPRDGLGGLSTSDLPLYGSEIVPELIPGLSVIVTEGERAAEALWPWNVPAFGTVTGASGTPGEDALSVLLPYDVILWPDCDATGVDHMTRVARSMIRLGITVRRIEWGERKGDDAADYVERGGTHAELVQMARNAQPWVPEPPTPEKPPQTRQRPFSSTPDPDRVQRARASLAQEVESALGPPARVMGRSLFWRCPFHDGDDTPSFKVDRNEPFYRCFGCGARGDVFSFLRTREGTSFIDALRALVPPVIRGVPVVLVHGG